MNNMRTVASYAAIVLGALLIIGAGSTWLLVSNTLSDQAITVSDDAPCAAGRHGRRSILGILPGQDHRGAHHGGHRR